MPELRLNHSERESSEGIEADRTRWCRMDKPMIDDLRSYTTMPQFDYNGIIMSAVLYKRGNTDLIDSFDIITSGYNLSKMTATDRFRMFGLTLEDMEKLKIRVKSYIDFKEGRLL